MHVLELILFIALLYSCLILISLSIELSIGLYKWIKES